MWQNGQAVQYIASTLDPWFQTLPFLLKEACEGMFSQLMMEAAGLEEVDQLLSVTKIEKIADCSTKLQSLNINPK